MNNELFIKTLNSSDIKYPDILNHSYTEVALAYYINTLFNITDVDVDDAFTQWDKNNKTTTINTLTKLQGKGIFNNARVIQLTKAIYVTRCDGIKNIVDSKMSNDKVWSKLPLSYILGPLVYDHSVYRDKIESLVRDSYNDEELAVYEGNNLNEKVYSLTNKYLDILSKAIYSVHLPMDILESSNIVAYVVSVALSAYTGGDVVYSDSYVKELDRLGVDLVSAYNLCKKKEDTTAVVNDVFQVS